MYYHLNDQPTGLRKKGILYFKKKIYNKKQILFNDML